MKRHFYKYILSAMMLVSVASCNVTDLTPVNVLPEDAAYATPANVELSVIGMYNAAQSGFYNGSETTTRGYIFGAAFVELGEMRGENMVLINVFYDLIYRATYTSTAPNVVNYWENGFRTINIANLVMEGVATALENGVIDQKTADQYVGEAKVIRAMTYHTLLVHFSRPYLDGAGDKPGMPLFTAGVNTIEEAAAVPLTPRSSVKDTYTFILNDLNDAESKLPVAHPVNKVTRVSQGAAIALKTRVYQHMGDWANVIKEGNKLIVTGTGSYKLGTTPDYPWATNAGTESIFSMEMSSVDNLDVNSQLANMLGSPAKSDGARGEVAISPILWNQTYWASADKRRGTTMVHTDGTRYFTHKYRDYVNKTDWTPVVRYAEVVLNVAEAESRAGDGARAITLLNSIRDRAKGGTMTSFTAASFANPNARTLAILQERTIELLAEGHRWGDIHRLAKDPVFSIGGIPAKMNSADATLASYAIGSDPVKGIAAIPYDDYRYLWPIPQSETTRNPTLAGQQNPGY